MKWYHALRCSSQKFMQDRTVTLKGTGTDVMHPFSSSGGAVKLFGQAFLHRWPDTIYIQMAM